MCSVTFFPNEQGFILGMNRDEKLSRPRALRPAFHNLQGCRALFPSEPGGGTWIGVNEHGVTLALLNWYAVQSRATSQSRGALVRFLLTVRNPVELKDGLSWFELSSLNPFRLVAVVGSEQSLTEFRWDRKQLRSVKYDWEPQAWFSSGFDEPGAQLSRAQAFRSALAEPDAGTLPWLRRLHSSHAPEPGPYSYCMHRDDAATVSYTEVDHGPGGVTMAYCEKPVSGSEPASHCVQPRGSAKSSLSLGNFSTSSRPESFLRMQSL